MNRKTVFVIGLLIMSTYAFAKIYTVKNVEDQARIMGFRIETSLDFYMYDLKKNKIFDFPISTVKICNIYPPDDVLSLFKGCSAVFVFTITKDESQMSRVESHYKKIEYYNNFDPIREKNKLYAISLRKNNLRLFYEPLGNTSISSERPRYSFSDAQRLFDRIK